MSNNLLKTELVEYLKEVELDEERVLANLVFDPGVIGQQLLENHFTIEDFKGPEANRVLLGTILEIIEDEENAFDIGLCFGFYHHVFGSNQSLC